MNYFRIFAAALGGTITYFVIGFLTFALLPMMATEFRRFPAVYRDQQSIKSVMPFGMFAMFISILVLAIIYAMTDRRGSGLLQGLQLGVLIGLFSTGAFVIHNYVNLNIGVKLAVQQSVVYFIEWMAVCVTIGLIYKPPASS